MNSNGMGTVLAVGLGLAFLLVVLKSVPPIKLPEMPK